MQIIFWANGYGVAASGNAAECLVGFIILQVLLKRGIKISGFRLEIVSFDATPKQMRKLKMRSEKKGMLVFPQPEGRAIAFMSGEGIKEIHRVGIKSWNAVSEVPAYQILKSGLLDEKKCRYPEKRILKKELKNNGNEKKRYAHPDTRRLPSSCICSKKN